eukprot:TRINITY_DN15255_c0_g1_i2.p1 TRINITY_DN15255_c0_g1~~TRINITY_DN15255_c0_g1_i2.p1  ORF type:complete len:1354 (+),score=302.55 TRINITY_DN15255_c0_g1_i2:541-4602(+)
MKGGDEPRILLSLCTRFSDPDFKEFYQRAREITKQNPHVAVAVRYRAGEEGDKRLSLQGYGVSMMIKDMEYKAMDDKDRTTDDATDQEVGDEEEESDVIMGLKFGKISETWSQSTDAISDLRDILREEESSKKAAVDINLKVWQIQNLGYQTCYKILKSSTPLSTLQSISQDFPRHANSLSRIQNPSIKRISKALKKAQNAHPAAYAYGEGSSSLFIAGSQVDIENLSSLSLYELVSREFKISHRVSSVVGKTASVSVPNEDAVLEVAAKILKTGGGNEDEAATTSSAKRYNLNTDIVSFMNDIEKDDMYSDWPSSIAAITKTSPYGMPTFPKRNLFTAINVLDPTKRAALETVHVSFMLQRQQAPIRTGFVIVDPSEDPESVASHVSCAFLTLFDAMPEHAFGFLYGLRSSGNSEEITVDEVVEAFSQATGKSDLSELVKSKSCSSRLQAANDGAKLLGLLSPGTTLLFNGMLSRNNPQQIVETFYSEMETVGTWWKQKLLKNSEKDIYSWIMNHFNAASKYQPKLTEGVKQVTISDDSTLLSPGEENWIFREDYNFDIPATSFVLTVDGDDEQGSVKTISELLAHFLSPDPPAISERARVVVTGGSKFATNLRAVFAKATSLSPQKRVAFLFNTLTEGVPDGDASPSPKNDFPQNTVFCNGKLIDLGQPGPDFGAGDFKELGESVGSLTSSIKTILDGVTWTDLLSGDEVADEVNGDWIGTKIMAATALVSAHKEVTKAHPRRGKAPPSPPPLTSENCGKPCRIGFVVEPRSDLTAPVSSQIDIVAVINPLSVDSQKISAILSVLHSQLPVRISIYLNPETSMSEIPIRTFYRYVSTTKVKFTDDGNIADPTATFTRLPEEQVLTMGVHEPEPWIVTTKSATYDLDNIKLSTVVGNVLTAHYELEHILVSGSCYDKSTKQPPRGLPLELSGKTDTLVMSNLGYFQLKASPGVWDLAIKEGRATDIFSIVKDESIIGGDTRDPSTVVVDSFNGVNLGLRVDRNKGFEKTKFLEETTDDSDIKEDNQDTSIMGKISSFLGGSDTKKAQPETADTRPQRPTLNIFSVASGHLYERFLKIMIHTTMQHIDDPKGKQRVKFWIINNFLSPQFKKTIFAMAEKWDFEVELVTYKWPSWLRRQTQKQRIIWGYKILFLDVLFPLDVEKVIFVDADQIIRSDLHELYNLDLEGKSVAYTPFCVESENKDTSGFRFWTSGFWKDHLAGAPYHISAIYVVDLQKFRKNGNGDSYRMIYDNLSADPNSLANLDQDLPNYAQRMVPIHSLPEHWLWCETWCNQESKKAAKTIDLCNNPLTKTPKLVNAKRIVPEWESYDNLIDEFEQACANGKGDDFSIPGKK